MSSLRYDDGYPRCLAAFPKDVNTRAAGWACQSAGNIALLKKVQWAFANFLSCLAFGCRDSLMEQAMHAAPDMVNLIRLCAEQ